MYFEGKTRKSIDKKIKLFFVPRSIAHTMPNTGTYIIHHHQSLIVLSSHLLP